jgi:hypothetical protein
MNLMGREPATSSISMQRIPILTVTNKPGGIRSRNVFSEMDNLLGENGQIAID